MNFNENPNPYDILSEDFADFALDECEEFADLADRSYEPVTANGQTFSAKVLGFGSSFKEKDHSHPPGMRPVEQCSSCRWADVAILHMDVPEPTYVVALMGKSVVPGEKHRLKLVFTPDPAHAFRSLFVPKRGPNAGPADKKIPAPNAVAFRRAATVNGALDVILQANEAIVPNPEPEGPYQDF